MVAISLYRGNMHRISPEVTRRWLMPAPRISVKDFRSLLRRRNKAVSHLTSSSSAVVAVANGGGGAVAVEKGKAAECDPMKVRVEEKVEKEEEKVEDVKSSELEVNNKVVPPDEIEKRKREVEQKLQVMKEKKHNLVQALKQILNAEEELKRRNIQAVRPPLPLQVEASNDSGSMTRHATPRGGSEANLNVYTEGGEGEDALNNNPQSRPLPRMSSTSPCAESALRRPPYFQHNAASHPSRAAMVAAGSPSRFAPSASGNQSHPSNLPTLSVSGTNYAASSPSPAASGGTSGFRDARHTSPWN